MQSDFYNLLKPLFVLTKNNGIIAALSFLLTIMIANELGAIQFGLYVKALIIASLIGMIINFSTDQTASVYYSQGIDKESILNGVLFIRLILGIISFAILIIYLGSEYTLLAFVSALLFSHFNLSFYYEITLRNERYSYIYLLERLVYVVSVFLVIFLDHLNINFIFMMIAITSLSSLIFQLIDVMSSKISLSSIKGLISFSFFKTQTPLLIVALSMYSFGGFSRLILEKNMGQELLGIYSAGWQLITIATIYLSQVYRIWRIRLAKIYEKKDGESLLSEMRNYILLVLLPLGLLMSIFYIFPEEIINFIYSKEYQSLSEVMVYFGIYVFIIGLSGFVDMIWIATARTLLFMFIKFLVAASLLVFLLKFSEEFTMIEFISTTIVFHLISVVILALTWMTIYWKEFEEVKDGL